MENQDSKTIGIITTIDEEADEEGEEKSVIGVDRPPYLEVEAEATERDVEHPPLAGTKMVTVRARTEEAMQAKPMEAMPAKQTEVIQVTRTEAIQATRTEAFQVGAVMAMATVAAALKMAMATVAAALKMAMAMVMATVEAALKMEMATATTVLVQNGVILVFEKGERAEDDFQAIAMIQTPMETVVIVIMAIREGKKAIEGEDAADKDEAAVDEEVAAAGEADAEVEVAVVAFQQVPQLKKLSNHFKSSHHLCLLQFLQTEFDSVHHIFA